MIKYYKIVTLQFALSLTQVASFTMLMDNLRKVFLMKRILILLLTVCLLLSSFAFIAHAEPYTMESEGYDVYEIQYILKKFGYFTHECTGYFGEATSLAVKAYQQDRGFEATGIAVVQAAARISATVSSSAIPVASKPLSC